MIDAASVSRSYAGVAGGKLLPVGCVKPTTRHRRYTDGSPDSEQPADRRNR
jgi:hypothetical protein